jgi:glutaredoxin
MPSSDKQVLPERTVTFYTKAGCHLCDDAREMLEEIATEIAYKLTEIDIRSDMALFEQYRYRIPVIIVDETYVVEGRIEYDALLGAFQR